MALGLWTGSPPWRSTRKDEGPWIRLIPKLMLAQILAVLARGRGVQVMPDAAELTTQQAADFLNVSRPYLIRLLETDEIPFRLVGTHRRVAFADLRQYKARDDMARRRAADDLTGLSQELGSY